MGRREKIAKQKASLQIPQGVLNQINFVWLHQGNNEPKRQNLQKLQTWRSKIECFSDGTSSIISMLNVHRPWS